MAAIPVELASYSWPTKKAAKAAFREVLYDPRYGRKRRVTDPDHVQMLLELLDRHPDSAEKIGPGVEYFFIGEISKDPAVFVSSSAIGIWIRRTDGSDADFSYNTAIDGRSHKHAVDGAMRHAVSDLRLNYREARFASGQPVECYLSGAKIIEQSEGSVIYNKPSWSQLTHKFATSQGGWSKIAVTSGQGAIQVGDRFVDRALEDQWIDFHEKHANLEIATASAASSRPRVDEKSWDPAW